MPLSQNQIQTNQPLSNSTNDTLENQVNAILDSFSRVDYCVIEEKFLRLNISDKTSLQKVLKASINKAFKRSEYSEQILELIKDLTERMVRNKIVTESEFEAITLQEFRNLFEAAIANFGIDKRNLLVENYLRLSPPPELSNQPMNPVLFSLNILEAMQNSAESNETVQLVADPTPGSNRISAEHADLITRAFMLFSKLTQNEFDEIHQMFLSIKTKKEFMILVETFFARIKTRERSKHFSALYQHLLDGNLEKGNSIFDLNEFCSLLFERCREFIEKDRDYSSCFIQVLECKDIPLRNQLLQDLRNRDKIVKQQFSAVIDLVVQLYEVGQLKDDLIDICIDYLILNDDEYSVIGVCKLLKLIGREFDINNVNKLDHQLNMLEKKLMDKKLSVEAKVQIVELLLMSQNEWSIDVLVNPEIPPQPIQREDEDKKTEKSENPGNSENSENSEKSEKSESNNSNSNSNESKESKECESTENESSEEFVKIEHDVVESKRNDPEEFEKIGLLSSQYESLMDGERMDRLVKDLSLSNDELSKGKDEINSPIKNTREILTEIIEKLTDKNIDDIATKLINVNLSCKSDLEKYDRVFQRIISQAVATPDQCDRYIELFKLINVHLIQTGVYRTTFDIKRFLPCGYMSCFNIDTFKNYGQKIKKSKNEDDKKKLMRDYERYQKRNAGVLKLVIEIYKQNLADHEFIGICIDALLEVGVEDSFRCLSEMLVAIGARYENDAPGKIDEKLKRLPELLKSNRLSKTAKSFIDDILIAKSENWIPCINYYGERIFSNENQELYEKATRKLLLGEYKSIENLPCKSKCLNGSLSDNAKGEQSVKPKLSYYTSRTQGIDIEKQYLELVIEYMDSSNLANLIISMFRIDGTLQNAHLFVISAIRYGFFTFNSDKIGSLFACLLQSTITFKKFYEGLHIYLTAKPDNNPEDDESYAFLFRYNGFIGRILAHIFLGLPEDELNLFMTQALIPLSCPETTEIVGHMIKNAIQLRNELEVAHRWFVSEISIKDFASTCEPDEVEKLLKEKCNLENFFELLNYFRIEEDESKPKNSIP